jgi:L-phenylalanine/L-methionine N-acetyltransferase
MPFALRSLELGDASSVHAIASLPSVARRLGGTPLDGVETWRARIQDLDSSRSLMIGAFEGGVLSGFAMLDGSPSVRQRHVASLALAVHPDHQRRGIGDQLITTLIESAERWYGFLRIELGVHAENEAAIALYEKHGFSIETRRRKDMLVDGVPAEGLGMARVRPDLVLPPALGAPPVVPPPGPRRVVTVRARTVADAAAFARLHQTDSVMEGTFQLPFQSEAHWKKRFESTPPGSHVLVAEIEGEVVGVTGLFPIGKGPRMHHVAGFGMSVDPRFQGCGVGHALMEAITDLSDHYLGLSRIVLEVYVDNERARHLYARHGFEVEGTLRAYAFRRGTYVDAYQMARVR